MSWRKKTTAEADAPRLAERAQWLDEALEVGGARFSPDDAAAARQLLTRVKERTALTGELTVVALAGATGSGKSSLFNTLVGENVAQIGARRPTTSTPSAAVWGDEAAGDLLDWLDISRRHRVSSSTSNFDELRGLVLLDLPDFDSRVAAHRAEADRILALADAFVWVTDPQKYADAVLHDEYVKQLTTSHARSVVVLNQVDRLTSEQAAACVDDLRELLRLDGAVDADVLTTSAVQPGGVGVLIAAIAGVVAEKDAAVRRLAGDVKAMAQRLEPQVGAATSERGSSSHDDELVQALMQAAGVDAVTDAVERDYRHECIARTGWPFTRWLRRFRAKPLSGVGLDDETAGSLTRAEKRMALGRSSLGPASPAARAAVDLATRRLGDQASVGLAPAWATAVENAAQPPERDLADALDQAVVHTPLRSGFPAWWGVVSVVQWILAAVAVVGAAWLLALFGLNALSMRPEVPKLFGWLPWPVLLLVVGLACGYLLALISRRLAARGATRAAKQARRRLEEAVREVAAERIVAPLDEVLAQHATVAKALAQAAA